RLLFPLRFLFQNGCCTPWFQQRRKSRKEALRGVLVGCRLARCGVLEVLHDGIGTRVQDRLVPTIPPAHDVRRSTFGPTHLQHLAVAAWIAGRYSSNDDAVA